MTDRAYIDTSALAKWYVREARSDYEAEWIRARAPVFVCGLTIVEMRSLLARHRREGLLDPDAERRVLATFESDLRDGHLVRTPWPGDTLFDAANSLIARCAAPLRTLDALQLAAALASGCRRFATADGVQADAAVELGLDVSRFHG